ncbi:MAG: PhoX family phosphatase [Gammaproteobacteria bacterium]|nr:PhoX family phosphatase [Gammaproteobacteria bacterium]
MTEQADGGAIRNLVLRHISRRQLLVSGSILVAAGAVGCRPAGREALEFRGIAPSGEDRVIVADGFRSDVVIRWGDSLKVGSDGLSMQGVLDGELLRPGAAAAQSESFGVSCDGMGIVPLDDDRLLLCINHETPEMGRMFPGWREAIRAREAAAFIEQNPDAVAVMRASVGVSVVEAEFDGDRWRVVADSRFNRRVTADTPIEFSGPAATHPWLGGDPATGQRGRCLGTFGNCAAGSTPWGTYLTAEENTNDFFGNGDNAEFEPLLLRANERLGLRAGVSLFRWELADDRFDHAAHPAESMKFGWIVEIDPRNPDRPIKKRTALGRFRHEGATTVLAADNRPVVYMGDDSGFEYFYKFVGDRAYDPADPDSADQLLDSGTLYVARLDDDGSGEWMPLVYSEQGPLGPNNGFESQADVVLRCREAADLLGATPLDRPEDVAVHPIDGRVYLACTQGTQRGLMRPVPPDSDEEPEPYPEADAANPRGPNPYGHILEFTEAPYASGTGGGPAAADPTAIRFRWEVFLLAGDPSGRGLAAEATAGKLSPAVAYYAGLTDSEGLAAFANPDNLGFDAAGNLWIVTDGTQPDGNNNGCFVCPTSGPERGVVRQFMSGPVGAEISGCTFSPDGQTLFLTVQHPGAGGSLEEPTSHWPDGGDAQPRSSLIAIRPADAAARFASSMS